MLHGGILKIRKIVPGGGYTLHITCRASHNNNNNNHCIQERLRNTETERHAYYIMGSYPCRIIAKIMWHTLFIVVHKLEAMIF